MVDDEGELVLIDMADISRGNGFYDLGGSYLLMHFVAKIPLLKVILKRITSLDSKTCLKMWDILMHRYFNTNDEELINKLSSQYRAFSNIRIAGNIGMNSSRSKIITKLMALYTRKIVIPKADEYVKIFSSLDVNE